MNRFQRVIDILDTAIGGPTVNIAVHRAFWRGLTRDEFVSKKVFGLDLVQLGQGADSNLVKALRGVAPFGSDLPVPPTDARFSRMPAGRPPVPDPDIAVIEQWINDGCPVGDTAGRPFSWRQTAAPDAGSRHDDVFFVSPEMGWAVNSDGHILRTDDGGRKWQVQATLPAYLRCVGFASATHGWVGTLSPDTRLFATTDGGTTWPEVTDLPDETPSRICGLSVVDESVVYASGTNFPFPAWPDRPPRMVKTVDGGSTWTAWDMSAHASNLIDTYFPTAERGWVVGGLADPSVSPGVDHRTDNLRAVVLLTEDGGRTWTNKAAHVADLPLGEWGWKIQFLDDRVGFVSLESMDRGAILKTVDGGETWERLEIGDPQGNKNLEGVGFIDEQAGWVGGWGRANFIGGFSSSTLDGGRTWSDANDIGLYINRFRFVGQPLRVGYAAGLSIYRYSDEPPPSAAERAAAPGPMLFSDREPIESDVPLRLRIAVPERASRLAVTIWERFGDLARRLVDQASPAAGPTTIEWNLTDDEGRPLDPGHFIVRVTVDDLSESRIVHMRATAG
jgi:photosystem II stability/assembly factor-like uncharacterized protein